MGLVGNDSSFQVRCPIGRHRRPILPVRPPTDTRGTRANQPGGLPGRPGGNNGGGLNTTSESLSESYPAIEASVPAARHAAGRYADALGFRGDQLDRVRLAVSEAVTNAVRHAYRGDPGEVGLTARVAGGELWLLVSDDGCGYQTPAVDPGLGFGLAVIADAADGFVITERAEGGTEVRMHFDLPRGTTRA